MKLSFQAILVILCLVTTLDVRPSFGAEEREEKLETAFLFQFAKYVDWPESSETVPFSFALVGDSPLMWESLQELAREKRIRERAIEVRRFTTGGPLSPCNVIFISSDNEAVVSQVLKKTKGTHALTVSHGQNLALKGVMINFYLTQDHRLRFEINRKAAEAEGLALSSQLLKLARIVE